MIFQAMNSDWGNISNAAEILGITRQTLQLNLGKYKWHDICNKNNHQQKQEGK